MVHKLLKNYQNLPIVKKLLIPQIVAFILGGGYIFISMYSLHSISEDYLSIKDNLLPALEKSIENNMLLKEISNDFTFSTLASENDFLENVTKKEEEIIKNLSLIHQLTSIDIHKQKKLFLSYYHYTYILVKTYIKLNKMIDDPSSLKKELLYYKNVQITFSKLHQDVKNKITSNSNYLSRKLKSLYTNNIVIGFLIFIILFIITFFLYYDLKKRFHTLVYEITKISPQEQIKDKMLQFSKDEFGSLTKELNQTFQKFNQEYLKIYKEKEDALMHANIDTLTQLYNRRFLNNVLKEMPQQYHAMALIDIDYFKKINDQYGHMVGDETLIYFSKILQEYIDNNDIVTRWGGEEFIILFSQNFTHTELYNTIEKLRVEIYHTKFPHIERLTVSIGATLYSSHNDTEEILKIMDKMLYEAKEKGRNCSVIYKNN